jgi:signal peptidase I
MEPTIAKGDRILVVSKDADDPVERGEIVVVASGDPYELPLLKRVLGVPGDRISWIGHAIFINEKPTAERFAAKGVPFVRTYYYRELGEDEYFVVGDNHGNSFDSTSFGAVRRDRLVGTAVYRYAPLGKLGWLTGE